MQDLEQKLWGLAQFRQGIAVGLLLEKLVGVGPRTKNIKQPLLKSGFAQAVINLKPGMPEWLIVPRSRVFRK